MRSRLVLFSAALQAIHALPVYAQLRDAPAGMRRFAADSFWVRAWTRGGAREPELLVEPRQVAAAGGAAMLLDLGTREVVGLDLRTGRTRFVLEARGEGPGEFRRPVHIARTASGFALLDQATSRLTLFDTAGRHIRSAASPNPFTVDGVCVFADGSALYKTSGAKDALVRVDSAGRTRERRSLPSAARGDIALQSSAFLVGPDARGACAMVARYGAEWFLVPRGGGTVAHRFVQAPPPPRVATSERTLARKGELCTMERTQLTQGQSSATGAMLVGDTLIVRGSASGRLMHRVLDYYLLPSGRYLHSRRLPFVFAAVAVSGDGTFIGIEVTEEGGVAHAFRPSVSRGERPSRDSVARRPRPAPSRRGGRP